MTQFALLHLFIISFSSDTIHSDIYTIYSSLCYSNLWLVRTVFVKSCLSSRFYPKLFLCCCGIHLLYTCVNIGNIWGKLNITIEATLLVYIR